MQAHGRGVFYPAACHKKTALGPFFYGVDWVDYFFSLFGR